MIHRPLVSVIIPTNRRPDLVLRAVRCALDQTLQDIEVIVVMGGPDEATASALSVIHDQRLRVLTLPSNSGVSVARNLGAREAQADWIAWLDDDDEWMPEKLEAQYFTATRSGLRYPIVSCRFYARTKRGDLLWPSRVPAPGERLDEYLFCRRGLFGGEGMVLLTTAMTRTDLARQVPFVPTPRRHQDIQWLMDSLQFHGCALEFIPVRQPLAVWNLEEAPARMSTAADWRESLEWARTNRRKLSHRAIAGFLLTWASTAAARSRHWKAFFHLPAEAFRLGRPRLIDLCAHLLIWLTPSWRNRISIPLQHTHE